MSDHQLFVVALVSAVAAGAPSLIAALSKMRQLNHIQHRLDRAEERAERDSENLESLQKHTNGMLLTIIAAAKAAGILEEKQRQSGEQAGEDDLDANQ